MNKTCFKKGCLKNPAFSCDCKSGIYFCKKHMGDHMLIQKNHNISPLLARLEDSDEILIKQKCVQVLEVYPKILEKAQMFCKNLIEIVLENSKKFQQEIDKIALTAKRIMGCFIRDTPIYTEDLSSIKKIEVKEISSVEFNFSALRSFIEQEFENHLKRLMNKRMTDDFVFYSNNNQELFDYYNERLHGIVLTGTFASNNLAYAPVSSSRGNYNETVLSCIDTMTFKWESKKFSSDIVQSYIISTIQLKKNIYFAISTSKNLSKTRIPVKKIIDKNLYFQKIDFNKNSIKTLYKPDVPISEGGIVLYSDLIFMFSCNQITFKFDIKKKLLTKITNLPEKCSFISASLIRDNIYVTGYCTSYIYKFNHSTNQFTNAIVFKNGKFRYLFENWLISMDDSFYELKDDNLINYGRFNDSSKGLANYSGFRRGDFIFFITQEGRLYKLDTIERSIKLVKIS